MLLAISDDTLQNANQGFRLAPQGKKKVMTDGDVFMATWLAMYLAENTEWRPDVQQRFLSSTATPFVTAVYNCFVSDYEALYARHGEEVQGCLVTLDHFRKKLAEWYPDVKIPKTNKFAQCDTCYSLK